MTRIQYQPSLPRGGYKPQQTDERKIARMREEAARQVQGMQRVAEAEIRSREKMLASMKEDAAYTAKAEERNFQIETANGQREIEGLQRQQVRDQQQFEQDQKDNLTILQGLASLSKSAGTVVNYLQEKRKKEKTAEEEQKAREGKTDAEKALDFAFREKIGWQVTQNSAEIVNAANIVGEQGGNPLAVEQTKVENPAQQRNFTEAGVRKALSPAHLNFRWQEWKKANNLGALNTKETVAQTEAFYSFLSQTLGLDGFSAEFREEVGEGWESFSQNLISVATNDEVAASQNTRKERAKTVMFDAGLTPATFNRKATDVYVELLDLNKGDRTKAWDDFFAYFGEVDADGETILDIKLLENFPFVKDGKETTVKEVFGGEGGRLDKLRQTIIKSQNEQIKLIRDTDNLRAYEDEQEAIQTFFAGRDNDAGTAKLAQELQEEYRLKHNRDSVKLNFVLEHLTYKARHRKNTFEQAEKLRDFELNPELVNGLCRLDPEKCQPFKERLNLHQSKYQGKSFTKDQSTISSSVSGRNTMLEAKGGERPMIVQLFAEHRDLLELYMASGMQFEAASAKAASDIDKKYQSLYKVNDPTNKYYRKVHRNGTVSYPYLTVPGASRADQARQNAEQLTKTIKDIGVEGLLNIPLSVASAERLAYIKENFYKDDFRPLPDEITVQSAAKKLSFHEMYNKLFAANGDSFRLTSPLKYNNQEVIFTPEQNAIIHGPGGINQKLAVINGLNPVYYQQASTMRPGSPVGQIIGPNTGIIVTDRADGPGGTDAVIKQGQRGAKYSWPLQGQVLKVVNDRPTEYRLEEGATKRDFGNYVEIRFRLPTGREVDALVSHFDQVANLKPGDVVAPNTFIGTQGRSGSTTGAHVSFDFYQKGTNIPDTEARDWFLKTHLQ